MTNDYCFNILITRDGVIANRNWREAGKLVYKH